MHLLSRKNENDMYLLELGVAGDSRLPDAKMRDLKRFIATLHEQSPSVMVIAKDFTYGSTRGDFTVHAGTEYQVTNMLIDLVNEIEGYRKALALAHCALAYTLDGTVKTKYGNIAASLHLTRLFRRFPGA